VYLFIYRYYLRVCVCVCVLALACLAHNLPCDTTESLVPGFQTKSIVYHPTQRKSFWMSPFIML
jgi:hypothetical protein